ncbi:MAG: LysR family transcriptional regulator [Oscillospiraceae bacterium]|nr:LysR family transcriptional regulator [Oscillospiraceae bacterium]
MTFLQIQCFSRLANNRRMNKTATEFNISPSALTKQMQQLEDELGAELFENTADGFVLTRYGDLIYPSMQFMAYQYSNMLLEMRAFAGQAHGKEKENTFKIVLPFHQRELLNALFDFKDANPDVSFQITEVTNYAIQNAVYNADVDLGIGYAELMDKKLSGGFMAKKDDPVVVISKKHPMADRESLKLFSLKDEKFYLFRDDELMFRFMLRMCIGEGFVPDVIHSNLRLNTIFWHVAENHGVTLCPKNSFDVLSPEGCVAVPLDKARYNLRMTMYIPNTYPSELCIRLVSFIQDRFNR